MKRQAESDLKNWYVSKTRKPLILRGARQVGKSTLVRNFAISNNLDLIEVNFEKITLKIPEVSLELSKILPEIEFVSKKKIGDKTLLFFDEIQECPKMITALRFFKEERPDIPVIAAGSLLEFALTINEISIPVGRIQYYHLGPFTFSEFVEALGEQDLLRMISSEGPEVLPEYGVQALKELYLKYLYIGGMPEAIQNFIDTKGQFNEVRQIQESIIQSFRDDFHKYSSRAELPRVRKVFDSITRIAGHKVKYTEIDGDEKSRDLKRAVDLLLYARVFLPVWHSSGTGVPLNSYQDTSVYKLFFLDVGLLGSLFKLDWNDFQLNHAVTGLLAEQFVAQHLIFQAGPHVAPELHYWLNDKKKHRAEVDFLIQVNSKILPIEVKAGATGQLKSLLLYLKQNPLANLAIHIGPHPFSIEPINFKVSDGETSTLVKGRIIKWPFYMIDQLKEKISKIS